MSRANLLVLALVSTVVACEKAPPSTPPDEGGASDVAEPESEPEPEADKPKPSHIEYVLEIDGTVTKAQIDLEIANHLNEIRDCYDPALQHPDDVDLKGAVVVKFAVDGDGKAESAELELSELGYPETERCLVGVVGAFKLPKQKGSSTVKLPLYMNVL